MSRVGKQPIAVPEKVDVKISGQDVAVKGPNGQLSWTVPPVIKIEQKDKELILSVADETDPKSGAMFGMSRTRVANLVAGVTEGFSKNIEIHGLGYKAQLQGQKLVLALGLSHPVEFKVPDGVKIDIDKKATKLTIKGIDKELVGETAARIRALKKPEPYKGVGIRYEGERIHRKAGKTAAGSGAK
ncbi:MAG: 50S ribosomal protein L6 [Elusimicrobia bacterium]|nr:MAG: 50S ribosomal protein L6 [Elusimicrobiota bacterium]